MIAKLFSKNQHAMFRRWTPNGVLLERQQSLSAEPINAPTLDSYLAQLADDGIATKEASYTLILWDDFYKLAAIEAYRPFFEGLNPPPLNRRRALLRSSGSYTDDTFSIALAGWRDERGAVAEPEATGPVLFADGQPFLMKESDWRLVCAVQQFAARTHRDEDSNRMLWGRVRELALQANAHLDDFLYRSVVLTPEKLQIQMRRSDAVDDDRVVELLPLFEGAPSKWLEHFDGRRDVPTRYDIVTPEGIVQVLITPQVRTVLGEIKRLPGRRVAGSRAQAFILNPFATLGPDANAVIDEQQFESARAAAGLRYERFLPVVERDTGGYPQRVGLLIEAGAADGPMTSETHWLADDDLRAFVTSLEKAVRAGHQLLAWNGFDLELSGDAPQYLTELKAAKEARSEPRPMVSYAQIHDLGMYSSRVEGIGTEKRYYSPYIAKRKDEEGWVPENIVPMVVYQPEGESEPIAVPTTREAIASLRLEVNRAAEAGSREVKVPWLRRPMSIGDATEIVNTFGAAFKDVDKGTFKPEKPLAKNPTVRPKALILRANIQSLDYEERRQVLSNVPTGPRVPRALKPDVELKQHQLQGLAWLQHLYGLRNDYQVRGAVLADDMGLGKTLQLLALIASILEENPESDPALIVAPVSLLENWAAEARRFFKDGALPMLTAYGADLASLRVSRELIDQRLQTEDGLVKFLKPNWVGTAKIVLTTYETLRDLEFSFAAQRWGLLVCDEAQKIKNPAAMVTRAAKKQNVAFKIACTGTPVENTLADLWCLFDYVQPGLLGALNDFGQRYRRPIEAKTEEEKARVDELRVRIQPQILRRLKSEVARDLPAKIVVDSCRRLPLSAMQRTLYASAISSFKKRGNPGHVTPFKNHLGLLHYLRLICTDPKPHGLSVFKPEAVSAYRKKAPKLDWLLEVLSSIRDKREKAIVFCEFREIQRLLRHYIEEVLKVTPDIINGDSSTSAMHTSSRQKRIDEFQRAPGFGVIILSPLAVGFGVNIQAANHVIHYTRTWNPAKEDQATDRAYRIGQTKDVYVYYPVVRADDFVTFDVKLDQLLSRKRELAGDMLNGSGDVLPGDFDVTEVVPPDEAADLELQVTLDQALQMEWKHFECLAGVLWKKQGYSCYRTPPSGDNGVDVVAMLGNRGILIQAKAASKDGQRLGWDAVKDVVTGAAFYQARHPGVQFDKVCLTNQFFNDQARQNAALNSVRLFERTDLEAMLQSHRVTMLEVEKMLYAEWTEA